MARASQMEWASGFLGIDVLAGAHGRDRRVGMHVVRGGDGDRIDLVTFFLQHLAPVLVKGNIWKLGPGAGNPFQAPLHVGVSGYVHHIAKRHHLESRLNRSRDIAGAFSSDADGAQGNLFVRAEDPAGNELKFPDGSGAGCRGALDEFPAGQGFHEFESGVWFFASNE